MKSIKKVAIFGATGSIGESTLKVIDEAQDVRVCVLTAHSNASKLARLAKKYQPDVVVIGDASKESELTAALEGQDVSILIGEDGLLEAAQFPVDWSMMAIMGFAGLPVLNAAIEQGQDHDVTIAIANKEPLVCAGSLILAKAAEYGVTLLPVDSEHNGIFQVFEAQNRAQIASITLTASGGPFLRTSAEQLAGMTPEQALNHPVWSMGAKISIDSATMMNKALEIIEASYFFGLPEEQIKVLIHPQSTVHGMTTYTDGSVLAHLGVPDMRVAIASALAYPQRMGVSDTTLDLAALGQLTFEEPDLEQFPALTLARKAVSHGLPATIALNAANEVAVAAFLDGECAFTDIVPTVAAVVEAVMQDKETQSVETLDYIYDVDKYARSLASDKLSVKTERAA